jgi:hypothetical protein
LRWAEEGATNWEMRVDSKQAQYEPVVDNGGRVYQVRVSCSAEVGRRAIMKFCEEADRRLSSFSIQCEPGEGTLESGPGAEAMPSSVVVRFCSQNPSHGKGLAPPDIVKYYFRNLADLGNDTSLARLFLETLPERNRQSDQLSVGRT